MGNNESRIVTVIGARPQFIKAAVVSREIRERWAGVLSESIVHTGQHFDENMSDLFFRQLGIPEPEVNLAIGGLGHGAMTGRMIEALETFLVERKPDLVLVYGDTNSTLAGTIAAVKLHVPVAHVEAGLRSRNRRMPEEINRILTDHAADLLLCPTLQAVDNLAAEGITRGVSMVGDVMYDASLLFRREARRPVGLEDVKEFMLLTLHRAENTDDPERVRAILDAIGSSASIPVVLPLHPRTRAVLARNDIQPGGWIRVIDPVGYLEMLWLEEHCRCVLTDSGGVQKEAYFFRKPCGTLRDETEWVETVEQRANVLLGADPKRIREFVWDPPSSSDYLPVYGDGHAAGASVRVIAERLGFGEVSN